MSRPNKILKDEDVIHKIHSQSGLEKDEILTLYPTEKERADFLTELVSAAKSGSDPKWEEDDFKLPPEEEKEAQELLQQAEKKKQNRQARQTALAQQQAKELSEATGVTPEEAALASLEALKHLDK